MQLSMSTVPDFDANTRRHILLTDVIVFGFHSDPRTRGPPSKNTVAFGYQVVDEEKLEFDR